MLKKLFYIGLGISIIAAKKSVDYLRERKAQSSAPEMVKTSSAAESSGAQTPAPSGNGSADVEADDLTKITGIGPTYAKRLVDAGITTFNSLSQRSPAELREVTKATGKSADPESWIAQAKDLT